MNKKKKKIKLLLFVMPVFALTLIFSYLPLWGLSFAFFQYKPGKNLFQCTFVGWENFTILFQNAVMRRNLLRVLKNTVGMHGLSLLFGWLPMLFAVLLSEIRSKKFQKTVQTITTLPNFISWVIIYSMLLSIFGSNGLVNVVLRDLGLNVTLKPLTTDKHVWLIQWLFGIWKGLGWSSIVYFAAIAGLDQEIFEAAAIDGAGRYHRIRYITVPLLIPTYFVLLVMSIGSFLNTGIDQHLVFYNALNKQTIETLDLYVYNLGIGGGQISYGVAVGMMKSIVALVLFSTANFASKKLRGQSVF